MRNQFPGKNVVLTDRSGVTLIEVLMSLMIMSIGIASVAALFPISMLRSLEATQLTSAAIIKRNVETILEVQPELLFDPDGDGNLIEHFRRPTSRNYIIDPAGFYTHAADSNFSGSTNYTQVFGNVNGVASVDGNGDPSVGGVSRFGGALKLLNGRFLGDGGAALTSAQAEALRLSALTLSGQGDGWTTQIETQSAGTPPTDGTGIVGVQLPDLDLSAVPSSDAFASTILGNVRDPELYRVVVFDDDGQFSQAFPLLYVNDVNNIVSWKEDYGGVWKDFNANGVNDARYLPAEFSGISRVLIQSKRVNDYSWMLSVRRRSDGVVRNVDVVIKFSDGANFQDERLYQATFVKDTNFVGIKYGAGAAPNIRKGKFIFDAQNARWYRIQDYRERSIIGWEFSNYDAIVITETTITEAGGEDQFDLFDTSGQSLLLNHQFDPAQYRSNGMLAPPFKVTDATTNPVTVVPIREADAVPGNGDGTLDFGLAMFPPGIVEVYPMGSRNIPAELINSQF